MPKSISQTPATVVIYCGNQVLSAPRGGFAAGAGASEMRPYQDDMADLHPALSSPSATPLRSGGYATRLSEPTERRRAQMLRRKTRLMEGEARDEGTSAELSDMRRRGSSDAR